MIRLLGIAAIALSIALIASVAFSHDWYEDACCNAQDCRPISGTDAKGEPWSEVEQTAEGYRWTSSRTGAVHTFKELDKTLLRDGEPRIRPPRDGRFHGCETGGLGGPEYSPSQGLCLYIPTSF